MLAEIQELVRYYSTCRTNHKLQDLCYAERELTKHIVSFAYMKCLIESQSEPQSTDINEKSSEGFGFDSRKAISAHLLPQQPHVLLEIFGYSVQ